MDTQTQAVQDNRAPYLPNIIIRGARKTDWDEISKLYQAYDFTLDTDHLELIMVAELDGQVIAAGALVKLIEAAFVINLEYPKKVRLEVLRKLLAQADGETTILGYKSYHVYATNNSIFRLLTKRFGFISSIGKSLIYWVNKNGQS